MKKNITLLSFTAILCFCSTIVWGQITPTISKEVVVSFANTTSVAPLEDIKKMRIYAFERYGVTITQLPANQLQCIPYTYLWTLTGTLNGIMQTVDYITTRPNGGSQNGSGGGHTFTPTNPTATLTTLKNPTTIPMALPPPCLNQDSLDAYSLCENRRAQPVLMAVIDDGIGNKFNNGTSNVSAATFFQPYLWSNPASGAANGTIGYNFLNNTNSPSNDNARHGSAVTFRIVDMLRKARVSNVKIMILETLDPITGQGSIWNICRALDFAYCNKANIVNMSLAGLLGKINANGERREAEGASVLEVIFEFMRKGQNTLIVAAAGNDSIGNNVALLRPDGQRYCTASYKLPNLMEVAANAACSDLLATFSNYGAPNVHLSAPGQDVYCAVPVSTLNPKGIEKKSGTSLAAPHVAAAAAILATNRPVSAAFDYAPIVKSILSSVTPLNQPVSTRGRLHTCRALTNFLSLYPAVQMRAAASNTEGTSSTGVINVLTLAPNPVSSEVTISLVTEEETQTVLEIKDILGRTIQHQNWQLNKGNNVLTIDASKLNKGLYFINTRIGEQNLVQKMIKN